MKTVVYKITLVIVVCLFSINTYGQMAMKDALNKVPVTSLPHNATKSATYKNSIGVLNPNNIMPNKLYRNVQRTDYFLAKDEDTAPVVYAKFKVPNSNYTIAAVSFGGITDWMTDVLAIVDINGNILSTLEANIWYYPGIPIKQFRISSDGSVVVSVLEPTSTISIPLSNFTQFYANRVDYTYKITNGKFVLSKTQKYAKTLYTRTKLSSKSYDLFTGGETPIN